MSLPRLDIYYAAEFNANPISRHFFSEMNNREWVGKSETLRGVRGGDAIGILPESSGSVYVRTSIIVPLNTSSAFWISGSFLKSSLLKGTIAGFFSGT